jgi:hypothetical protein
LKRDVLHQAFRHSLQKNGTSGANKEIPEEDIPHRTRFGIGMSSFDICKYGRTGFIAYKSLDSIVTPLIRTFSTRPPSFMKMPIPMED